MSDKHKITERWKPVKGYEGIYEVSSCGNIRNSHTGAVLKPQLFRSGYLAVYLYKQKERKTFKVHRLVSIAFLDAPNEGETQINHKDMNKLNNNVENLEWCTPSYNVHHSWVNGGRLKNEEALMKALRKPIEQRTIGGKYIKTWTSLSEAARCLGINVSNICACANGRIRSCGGFKWIKCSDI